MDDVIFAKRIEVAGIELLDLELTAAELASLGLSDHSLRGEIEAAPAFAGDATYTLHNNVGRLVIDREKLHAVLEWLGVGDESTMKRLGRAKFKLR